MLFVIYLTVGSIEKHEQFKSLFYDLIQKYKDTYGKDIIPISNLDIDYSLVSSDIEKMIIAKKQNEVDLPNLKGITKNKIEFILNHCFDYIRKNVK